MMKRRKIMMIATVALGGIALAVWMLGPLGQTVRPEKITHEEHPEDGEDHRDHEDERDDHPRDHEEEEGHGEDEGDSHDEHSDEPVIRMSTAEQKEFGIEVDTAGPGTLRLFVELPGEIVPNADRLAHVVPRAAGIVQEVRKKLGDRVQPGEVMAVLESRELADAKAMFLASRERVALANANYLREENLWEKKISSEQDYLKAKQVLAEARIERRSAEQKLHAFGFSHAYLAQLSENPEESFTRYEIIAPFGGEVIEKHITLGEVLPDDAEAFVIADLSTVWIDLNVYQKDLPLVREGQLVVISAGHGLPDATGKISYLRPVIGEETRTALARIVLPNKQGKWRPGLFVTGKIAVEEMKVPLVVPRSALQTVENKTSVFVQSGEGFEPWPVTLGQSDDTSVEIKSGLVPGQRYVAKGSFTLKAQLSKGAFGEGHAH